MNRSLLFVLLAAAMVIVAGGHLYLISDRTEIHVGLPEWVWLQLVIVGGLLILAWIATGLVIDNEVE